MRQRTKDFREFRTTGPADPLDSLRIVEVRSLSTDEVTGVQIPTTSMAPDQWGHEHPSPNCANNEAGTSSDQGLSGEQSDGSWSEETTIPCTDINNNRYVVEYQPTTPRRQKLQETSEGSQVFYTGFPPEAASVQESRQGTGESGQREGQTPNAYRLKNEVEESPSDDSFPNGTFTESVKKTLQIVGGRTDSTTGPVKCFHCEKTFDNPSLLKVHSASHVTDKALQCAFCGKKFTSAISHRTHLRIHTGEKPCVCKICGKSYRYSGHLTRHIRSHSGQRPHRCPICSKTFLSSGELCNHKRRHGNTKPFKCAQCQSSFFFSRDLITHRFTHANETFNCPVCTQMFKNLVQLTSHIQTAHRMFRILVCKICSKIFANPSRFKKHSYVHLSESKKRKTSEHPVQLNDKKRMSLRLYSCKTCGEEFFSIKGLQYHEKSHLPDLCTSCMICGQTMRDADELKVHLDNYHNTGVQEMKGMPRHSSTKGLNTQQQMKGTVDSSNFSSGTEIQTANLIAKSVFLASGATHVEDRWASSSATETNQKTTNTYSPNKQHLITRDEVKAPQRVECNYPGSSPGIKIENVCGLRERQQVLAPGGISHYWTKDEGAEPDSENSDYSSNEEEDNSDSDKDQRDSADEEQKEMEKRKQPLSYIVYQKNGEVALSDAPVTKVKPAKDGDKMDPLSTKVKMNESTTDQRNAIVQSGGSKPMLSFLSSDRLGINNNFQGYYPPGGASQDFMTYTYILPSPD